MTGRHRAGIVSSSSPEHASLLGLKSGHLDPESVERMTRSEVTAPRMRPPHARSWLRGLALIAVAGLGSVVAYVVSVEVQSWINREAFASRPEVENWALPYYGTEGPALFVAICAFIGISAVGFVIMAARSRKTSGRP